MTMRGMAVSALSMSLLLGTAGTAPADGKRDKRDRDDRDHRHVAALQLPITGTTSTGGSFAGTVSIRRFAVSEDGKTAVAIGFVRGTATGAAGTVLAGAIAFPVTVSSDGPLTSAADTAVVPQAVAPQAVCQVVNIELGAVNLNVLGLQVVTQPISLAISGDTAGPLGNLACTLLDTVNTVVDLVGILNTILGLLTGLLGGIGGLLP